MLEAGQPRRAEQDPRGAACRQQVELTYQQRLGRTYGPPKDLANTGRQSAEDRVPGQIAQSATNEHEARRALDNPKRRRQDEPGGKEREKGSDHRGHDAEEYGWAATSVKILAATHGRREKRAASGEETHPAGAKEPQGER